MKGVQNATAQGSSTISIPDNPKSVGRMRRHFRKKIYPNIALYLFCLPGLIVTFIFSYIPLYGVQIAFRDFSYSKGYLGSTWVGLEHFQRFFSSPMAVKIISNTAILSLYSLLASFPLPIILALMINSFRHKRYGKTIQTVTYAPNFISVVVMASMVLLFLSPTTGIVNHLIGLFGAGPINFMAEQGLWRHIYVWSGVWQGTGWGAVIYMAALAGVSPEYHEAAVVDGASKLQRMWHIDLPFLIPIASVMLILNFGSLFSIGFEKAYALQNNTNLDVSEIIATYVYKVGLVNNDISFGAAIGLFNSAVNAVMLLVVNFVVRRTTKNSLF